MGRKVETTMEWMKDVAEVIYINVRKGGENTVEYVDRAGNNRIVRVPISLIDFLDRCNYAMKTYKKAA